MSWTLEVPSPSASFEIPPAGSQGACLVAIVDLGTHEEEYAAANGKPARKVDVHQAFFVWELPGKQVSGTSNNHLIGRQINLSLNEKSALRKLIKSWRGRDLAVGEQFDLLKMLGQKCLLSISHKEVGDKVYATLDGVSGLPGGMAVADPKRKPVAIHISEPDSSLPDWLPRVYGEEVRLVRERARERTGRAASAQPATQPGNGKLPGISEDSIPF